MPLPIDPRRAYLTADIGSSLGCKDEDCNFKTPWNFIKIVLYTLFSVFCMTLATGIQVFVGVMFTFAMYAVNFLIPYCTTNLLTWPLIGFIIFGWVYTQLWEWVEQDLEGSFVENNPVLARAGKVRARAARRAPTHVLPPTSSRPSNTLLFARALSWLRARARGASRRLRLGRRGSFWEGGGGARGRLVLLAL